MSTQKKKDIRYPYSNLQTRNLYAQLPFSHALPKLPNSLWTKFGKATSTAATTSHQQTVPMRTAWSDHLRLSSLLLFGIKKVQGDAAMRINLFSALRSHHVATAHIFPVSHLIVNRQASCKWPFEIWALSFFEGHVSPLNPLHPGPVEYQSHQLSILCWPRKHHLPSVFHLWPKPHETWRYPKLLPHDVEAHHRKALKVEQGRQPSSEIESL